MWKGANKALVYNNLFQCRIGNVILISNASLLNIMDIFGSVMDRGKMD